MLPCQMGAQCTKYLKDGCVYIVHTDVLSYVAMYNGCTMYKHLKDGLYVALSNGDTIYKKNPERWLHIILLIDE